MSRHRGKSGANTDELVIHDHRQSGILTFPVDPKPFQSCSFSLLEQYFLHTNTVESRKISIIGAGKWATRASMLNGQERGHEAVEADFAARRAKLTEGSV